MKTQLLMAAIIAGFVLNTTSASAQGRGEQPDFATLDANGDGAVTLAELQAQGAARFAQSDADGDGALSAEELLARMQAHTEERAQAGVERMITRLDENEDGVLQEAELNNRRGDQAERMFDRADTDDNGEISAAEFEDAKERRGGGRKGGHGKGKRDGRGHGGRG